MTRRGGRKYSTMDKFLGHQPGSRRGRNTFSKWKEKGYLHAFLFPKSPPALVYRHSLPTQIVIEDKDTKESRTEVWPKSYACHETEETLEAMYFRDDDGNRKNPPERCGLCKLVEYLWLETWKWAENAKPVKEGKGKLTSKVGIDPALQLFKFETEDARKSEDQVLTAGGMCGMLGHKDCPEEVIKHAKILKVQIKELFKEKAVAKPEYVIPIVDADDVSKGPQIAIETKGLGLKIQDAINKVYKSEEIRYEKAPYCLRWEKKKEEGLAFDKIYDVFPVKKIKPTPEILKMIRGEAPNIEKELTPFNQQTMKAILHEACLHKDLIPWDELFPSKEQEKKWAEEDEKAEKEEEKEEGGEEEEEDEDGDEEDEEEEESEDDDEDSEEDEEDEEEEEDELFECDNEDCKKPVKASDKECPHCGYKFEVAEDEEKPKEQPQKQLKKRSEMKAEKAAAAEKKTTKKKSKKDEDEDDAPDNGDDEEVPF